MSSEDSNCANADNGQNEQPPQWPLSFQIQKPLWSYEMYRGPAGQTPELIYCSTKHEAERLAAQFLKEKIVGFGVEWKAWYGTAPSDARLQDKVSLIQLATEYKIALFHIAAHEGETPEDFLAPSLRKIIESPKIIKATSAILGDFKQLKEAFKDIYLQPKGGIDLSYLHNLVTYGSGPTDQWKKLTTKGWTSFVKQIETHFGLPFVKETTGWNEEYLSKTQQKLAASDAYAGLMLYHCLESKRVAMVKKPPRLLCAELYPWFKYERGVGTQILLVVDMEKDEETETWTVITAKDHLQGALDRKFQKVFRRSDKDDGEDAEQQRERNDAGDEHAEPDQVPAPSQEECQPNPELVQRTPAPRTPPRPPTLSTGLTVALAKTSFSGIGTEAQPFSLDDSDDEDRKTGILDTPTKPQKRKLSESDPDESPQPGRIRADGYWENRRELKSDSQPDNSSPGRARADGYWAARREAEMAKVKY